MRIVPVFLVAIFFVVSCVPKKKFDTLANERNAIQLKMNDVESKLSESSGELAKSSERTKSLEGQVGNLSGSLAEEKRRVEALTENLNNTSDQLSQAATRHARVQEQYARLYQSVADIEKYKGVADARVAEFWSLRSKLGAEPLDGKPNAVVDGGRVLVVLPVDALFVNNSANLSPNGLTMVREVSKTLGAIESRPNFIVETHTDSTPARGPGQPTNRELGAARALAIAEALTTANGGTLAPNRVGALTYGDSSPQAPNNTPEGRSLNRRAYVVIQPNDALIPGSTELKSAYDAVSSAKINAEGRGVVLNRDSAGEPPPPPAAPPSEPPLPAEPAPVVAPPPPQAATPAPEVGSSTSTPVPPPTAPATAPNSMIPPRPAPPPAPMKQGKMPTKLPRIAPRSAAKPFAKRAAKPAVKPVAAKKP